MPRASRRSSRWGLVLLAFLAGCSARPANMDRRLDRKPPADNATSLRADYTVRYPDVVELVFEGRPEWSGKRRVLIDGRVEVAPNLPVRVEGLTVAEIVKVLATQTGIDAEKIDARVAEFNSQQVFVYGEVKGQPRAVPYQGPETVVQLLQRVGGITPGASAEDVKLVRAHVADGQQPEVFEIDLEAVLLHNDHKTDIRLKPFDQIYVGETRRNCLEKVIPPWFKPIYNGLCGRKPSEQSEPRP